MPRYHVTFVHDCRDEFDTIRVAAQSTEQAIAKAKRFLENPREWVVGSVTEESEAERMALLQDDLPF